MSTFEPLPPMTDDETSASPRELADLARAGYAVLRQPLMQVTFEVHHVSDRPGYLADYLQGEMPDDKKHERPSFGETLTTGAGGLGLVVVTRTAVGTGSRRQYLSSGQVQCDVHDSSERRIFRGTARPSPSFIYESAWRFEGLICIEPSQKLRFWHCHVIRDVVHYVAQLAQHAKLPILSLQAPAQIPPSELVTSPATAAEEERMLTPASSIAVRFAIAIQNPDARTIVWLSSRLEQYCIKHGLGLWLADTRLGSRPGNWFNVCSYDSDTSYAAASPQRASTGRVRWGMPVTLVGPARVGSIPALTAFLNQYGDVGLTACSIISLDDLLFIHLDIAMAKRSESSLDATDTTSDEARSSSALLPSEALTLMLERLGYGHRTDHQRTSSLLNNAGDYQCLIGPARPMKHESEQKRMAVWFSWQTQGIEFDLAVPLDGLFQAFADVQLVPKSGNRLTWAPSSPRIEYLVCRNMGNSILRGKGKLSVIRDTALRRYPDDALESRPTNLCVGIEEAWRSRTARNGHPGLRELTVAWRECWLGHWSLPL